MNDLGWMVIGAAARVTPLAALGLAAAWLLRRRGPSAGALAASTTLAVVVAVSGLAASPWPRWSLPGAPVSRPGPARGPESSTSVDPTEPAGDPAVADRGSIAAGGFPLAGFAGSFLVEFRRELASRDGPGRLDGWRWPAWAAVGFLAGLAVALARLAVGLRAVRRLRARARPVDDPALTALADALCAEMGLRRGVEIRESAEVGTPATIGWRAPAILLPPSWSDWDDAERRAVLAHELAHVLRGDYGAGLAAQFSLSLHFYHPLVHALAGRLRLQQELAADAWGARLAGGRRAYMNTLASLALRQDPRPAAWPARPFLPTRGTFLRRIEMLRDPHAIPDKGLPRRGQAATVAALVAAGLVIAGFRGPAPSAPTLAQDVPAKTPTPIQERAVISARGSNPEAIDPASAGSDAHLVIDLRPAALLKSAEFRKVVGLIPADGPAPLVALASGEIEQVVILGFDRDRSGPRSPSSIPPQLALLIRATRPVDWKTWLPTGGSTVEQEGFSYLRADQAPGSTCFRKLDDRTLLIGTEADVKLPPIGADRPRGRHDWDDAWKTLTPGPIRLALDTAWVARQVQPPTPARGRPGSIGPMTIFGPLLEKATAYGLTIDLADGLTLDGLATCGTAPGAERVADTLRAALTLARNALPGLRLAAETGPPDAARSLVDLTDAAEAMLESSRIEGQGTLVRLKARADVQAVATAARMLLPAVQASREAARRAQCVNNLKQIGLAMHNYHSVNDCFPPAVLYGPDGKTPHSWRVALLPFLEANNVYSRYKFDEPWDGPNNRQLIPLMPTVYAHPAAPGEAPRPGMTAYFVPTGPNTLFPDRKQGTRMAEITDGTSNTIMVVEALREIPWTRPEDIPLGDLNASPKPPLPNLGSLHPGGFDALFGDGAVRFLSATVDHATLRALYTKAGNEVISRP